MAVSGRQASADFDSRTLYGWAIKSGTVLAASCEDVEEIGSIPRQARKRPEP